MYRYLQNWHIINHGDGYPISIRLTRLPNNEPYSRLPNIEFDGFNLISHLTHSHPHARSCWFTDTRRSAEQPEVGAAKLLSHFRPLMQFESIHSSPTVSIVICWSILPTCYNRYVTPTWIATSSANKYISAQQRVNMRIAKSQEPIQQYFACGQSSSTLCHTMHFSRIATSQYFYNLLNASCSTNFLSRLEHDFLFPLSPNDILVSLVFFFLFFQYSDFVRQHVGKLIRLASTILSSEKVIQENLPWTAYFAIRRRFPITSDALARVQI